MIVAKGTFAVPAMFRLTKDLLARPMSKEDDKNKILPHFKREFTQLVHCKLLVQCNAQHLQKGLSLQKNVVEQQQ